jgi:hypothetical protein
VYCGSIGLVEKLKVEEVEGGRLKKLKAPFNLQLLQLLTASTLPVRNFAAGKERS